MFYNNKNGLIPDYVLTKYKNKKHPNDVYSCYKDTNLANKIHNYFLENLQEFVNNLNKPISLDDHKESICFFGVTKKNFIKFFTSIVVGNTKGYDMNYFYNDEPYIYKLKGNFLFPRFVVSHYAFGPQRKGNLDKNIIVKYKELSLKALNFTNEL